MLEDIIYFFMNDGISFFIGLIIFLVIASVILSICGIVLTFIASLKGNCVDQATWENIRNEYYEEEERRLDEEARKKEKQFVEAILNDDFYF